MELISLIVVTIIVLVIINNYKGIFIYIKGKTHKETTWRDRWNVTEEKIEEIEKRTFEKVDTSNLNGKIKDDKLN